MRAYQAKLLLRPAAPSQERRPPAFQVTSVFRPQRPRTLVRDDLDMQEQFQEADRVGRVAVHNMNWDDYKKTCASQKTHEHILMCLLVEADRHHFGDNSSTVDESTARRRRKIRRRLLSLRQEVLDMLEESENKYPSALTLIASKHLFNDDNSAETCSLPTPEA